MKKVLLVLTLTMVLLLSTTSVKADIGPKPSVTITIVGMEDVNYTLELLSEDVGGNFLSEETYNDTVQSDHQYAHYKGEEYPLELLTFTSSDHLSPWTIYGGPMPSLHQRSTHEFEENYYPPNEFRVLLYLEDGTSIVSELVSRRYFNSTMVWDVTDVDKTVSSENLGEITGNIHIGVWSEPTFFEKLQGVSIPRLLLRILITVLIEAGVLFIFRYKKLKSYNLIVITNVLTQIVLTLLVASTYAYSGALAAMILLLALEAVVFLTEGLVYGFFLKEKKVYIALLYAVIANAASLIIGYFLLPWM